MGILQYELSIYGIVQSMTGGFVKEREREIASKRERERGEREKEIERHRHRDTQRVIETKTDRER